MENFSLNQDACRSRQRRLLDFMAEQGIELCIVTQRENIQWLTGQYFKPLFQPVAALSSDGHLTLVAPAKPPIEAAVDEIVHYEAQWHSTLRNDQRQAAEKRLLETLGDRPAGGVVGVEYSSFGQHLATAIAGTLIDIEPDLYFFRRRKEEDELLLIRQAIAATQAMYQKAREIIEPGISELEVFNQLQAAAVEACGEMLTGTGNDYQCCSRGGSPRAGQTARPGDLYILDLGPAFRGYFADNCRTGRHSASSR